jgi:hypothetical protein
VRGWVAMYSILSRTMGRVDVAGKGEGVVGRTGTSDGRSDDSAAVVQSIGLTGPLMI